MNDKIIRFPRARWGWLKLLAAVVATLLLMPVLLLAVLPMLIMFVPVALVAIPVIAPMMLSGKLAARWEAQQPKARSAAPSAIKTAHVVVR